MSAGTSRWTATSASVRGASHERTGLPNQDATEVVEVAGSGLIAAVADGHGGVRYVRSDVGARFGVDIATTVGRDALASLGPDADTPRIRAHVTGPMATEIVDRWSSAVLAHLAEHPFTEEERTRAGAPVDDDPLISYGCTLILAILGTGWVGLFQIGDGDATVVTGDRVDDPVPGDDRLVGGETTSLCLPSAAADARVAIVRDPLPDLVVLTSDGYANSFASADWRASVGVDLQHQIDRDGLDAVAERVPGWLADSARAGGDDVSMVLVHRVQPGLATPASSLAAAAPTSPSPSRPRGRLTLGIVALLVGAAIGLLAGWALGGDRATATASATTTTPPTVRTTLPTTTTVLFATAADDAFAVGHGNAGAAVLVAYNANARAPSLRIVQPVTAAPVLLPAGWTLDNGLLRRGTQVERDDVAYVMTTGNELWAFDATGVVTTFDARQGRKIGTSTASPSVGVAPSPGDSNPTGTTITPTTLPTSPKTAAR